MIDLDAPVADLVLAHSATATVLDRRQNINCYEGICQLGVVIFERPHDRGALPAVLAVALGCSEPAADPRTATTSALISRALARQRRHRPVGQAA